jgi:Tfp pilus assembly protein PilV
MRVRTRGVSIAETLIAIFLLALLILAVFNMFPTTVLANRQGSERLQAVSVAQSALAEARSRPFGELTIGMTESLPEKATRGTTYMSQLKVLAPDQGSPDRLKVLEVTVTWQARNIKRSIQERLWIHRRIEEKA